jgi:flagellar rod assembly protein/muramidase FlgJ
MTPIAFISALTDAARASAAVTKIPASFTIAEAALESGWGASQLAQHGFNLFGVKADASWTGPTLDMNTREFLDGHWVMQVAKWRSYDDWLGAITDHAAFLQTNPRYEVAFQMSNGEDFARAVAAAGYATDPAYAEKIISIMHAHNLMALDSMA